MMTDAELDDLAQDIKTNGLQQQIATWKDRNGKVWLLDGRSRLEACSRAGVKINDAEHVVRYEHTEVSDPAAFVISANVRRRHLSKQQQAELIVKAVEASQTNDGATSARSFSPNAGQRGGSTKDPVLAKAVTEAKRLGIGERTVQNARC
jgi:hypothetical protein